MEELERIIGPNKVHQDAFIKAVKSIGFVDFIYQPGSPRDFVKVTDAIQGGLQHVFNAGYEAGQKSNNTTSSSKGNLGAEADKAGDTSNKTTSPLKRKLGVEVDKASKNLDTATPTLKRKRGVVNVGKAGGTSKKIASPLKPKRGAVAAAKPAASTGGRRQNPKSPKRLEFGTYRVGIYLHELVFVRGIYFHYTTKVFNNARVGFMAWIYLDNDEVEKLKTYREANGQPWDPKPQGLYKKEFAELNIKSSLRRKEMTAKSIAAGMKKDGIIG